MRLLVVACRSINPPLIHQRNDDAVEARAEAERLKNCEHDQREAAEEQPQAFVLEPYADSMAKFS